MKRTLMAVVFVAAAALPVAANDSPTSTKFLFDYVGALRLIHAGDAQAASGHCNDARADYDRARALVEPYRMQYDVHQSVAMVESAKLVATALEARDACAAAVDARGKMGLLSDSAAKAAWGITQSNTGVWVGARDRRHAMRELRETFGPDVAAMTDDKNDLELGAAMLACFLSNPPQPYHSPWARYNPWGR